MLKEANAAVVEEKIDEVRVFMLFTLFGGDVKRVAAVTRVDVRRIESLAHDFRWADKLVNKKGLATEEGAEDERAINRATNYVTADRLKRVFGRLIDELDSDPTFARQFCTTVDGDTQETSFNTKNLVELAKGLQIVNDISYRALQDKQAQAADIVGKAGDPAAMALATYKALVGRFDRNVVVDATAVISTAVTEARCDETTEEKQ